MTDGQMDRWTDEQTGQHTYRQTDRWAERWKKWHIEVGTPPKNSTGTTFCSCKVEGVQIICDANSSASNGEDSIPACHTIKI